MQSNSFDNCVHCYDIEIVNHFHPKFQLIITKPAIKNKFKKNAKWVEKLQAILVLEYKKINVRNIFHSSINKMLVIQILMKHLYPCIKIL